MLGHESARQIHSTLEDSRKLALILPVGPLGKYHWADLAGRSCLLYSLPLSYVLDSVIAPELHSG